MKSLSTILILLLAFSFSNSFGQSKSSSENKKQYQYSFEGELDTQSISDLESKLSSLQFVTLAKVKYKADSKKGEVILRTLERTISSEDQKGFDLIELKKLLITTSLTPLEVTFCSLN